MHLVAITRARLVSGVASAGYRDAVHAPELSREELAKLLAEQLGGLVYDWRVRLGTPAPWIVARTEDASAAERIEQALAGVGLRSIRLDTADAKPWTPRGAAQVSLDAGSLRIDPDGLSIEAASVRVAVLATLDHESSREDIEHVRVEHRYQTTMPVTHYQHERRSKRALYLFMGPEKRGVRLEQGQAGLAGDPSAALTSFDRFEQLVRALEAGLAHARWDRSLLEAQRSRNKLTVGVKAGKSSTSNEPETDAVARIIAVDHMATGA